MAHDRVDLFSAGSYAVAPSDLRRRAGADGTPSDVLVRREGATSRALPASAAELGASLATAAGRLAYQDDDGVAGEILLPDPELVDALLADGGTDRRPSIIAEYHAWAGELQAAAPDRLVAVGQIPTTGPDDAVAALRSAQAAGLRAVALAGPPAGPGTSPTDADEFWRVAGDHTVVCLGPHFGGVGFAERFAPRVGAGKASAHVGFLTRIALSGLWDDMPGLRMVIAGVDAGWIPYMMEKADTNYLRTRASRPVDLRRDDALPSEYIREHTFATFGNDRAAVLAAGYFGESHLMWSAALPTITSSFPADEEQAARITSGLPAELRRRLLGENCRRLFRVGDAAAFTTEELGAFERPVLV